MCIRNTKTAKLLYWKGYAEVSVFHMVLVTGHYTENAVYLK